jgi:hypothetical protein
MKKSELKKILKPLIRECIREVILEENGIISSIVSEVANGLSTAAPTAQIVSEEQNRQEEERFQQSLEEAKKNRKALLDSIGTDSYGGVDVFEGTIPAIAESNTNTHSPLAGRNPNDSGVDITSLMNSKSAVWRELAGTKKKG